MHRANVLLLLVFLPAFVALPAAGADNGFYIGGAVGQSSFDAADLGGVDIESDATGYKVFVGGRFLQFLGVEASYADFGDLETGGVEGIDADATAPVYKVGLQFRIRSFAVRAAIEYFDIDDVDELCMISVGGSYAF
jgi:hypothetical protein